MNNTQRRKIEKQVDAIVAEKSRNLQEEMEAERNNYIQAIIDEKMKVLGFNEVNKAFAKFVKKYQKALKDFAKENDKHGWETNIRTDSRLKDISTLEKYPLLEMTVYSGGSNNLPVVKKMFDTLHAKQEALSQKASDFKLKIWFEDDLEDILARLDSFKSDLKAI